jgi:hypothetical protein
MWCDRDDKAHFIIILPPFAHEMNDVILVKCDNEEGARKEHSNVDVKNNVGARSRPGR